MTPWRAELNYPYWFVGMDGKVRQEIEKLDDTVNGRYEAGNYFKFRTGAARASRWMQAGLHYIRGETSMGAAIERLIQARKVMEGGKQ